MAVKRRLAMTAAVCAGLAALASPAAQAQPRRGIIGPSTSAIALLPMPAGHLSASAAARGRQIHVSATGLTPGSSHEVVLARGGCATRMRGGGQTGTTTIGTITAGTGGAVDSMLRLPMAHTRSRRALLILLGAGSTGFDSKTVIACAPVPSRRDETALHSVSKTGVRLSGQAQLTYDAARQSLTVHVHATGFRPWSEHAAHIHQGSCESQGKVLYMLQDLRANGHGVVDATRTVTGVMSAPPATGWYLNIHMGNSSNILAAGQPTLEFQPRLCANISGNAALPGASPHGQVTTSGGERFLSLGEAGEKIMTIGPFTFTADCTNSAGYTQAVFNVVSSENGSDLDGGGPVAAGTVVQIHADPAGAPTMLGAFAQSPSASTSTEIAPDGTEVDVFYNDGVNFAGHACFAGAIGFES